MAFKFVLLAAFVAVANAGILPAAAPLALAPAPIAKTVITKVADAEYDPNPQYSYAYDVADSITGDFKSQQETRNGDVVQGSYSLLESDGTRRVVDYAADPLNGFNAVVRKEPVAVKAAVPVAAPVAVKAALPAPVAYAAPAVAKVAAPFAYAAPAFAPAAYASYAAGPAFAPAPYAAYSYGAPAFAKTFF